MICDYHMRGYLQFMRLILAAAYPGGHPHGVLQVIKQDGSLIICADDLSDSEQDELRGV